MENRSNRPRFARLAQGLFLVNTIIWVGLAVGFALKIDTSNPDTVVGYWIVAMLMFGNAAAMFVCGIGIGRPRRLFYVLALAVLFVNIVLTFTDQFGTWDFITLVVDVVVFGLLMVMWSAYLRRPDAISGEKSAGH
jgi:lysylphosphatidylglycerol synthetase-like protein (DUF2156 family)